MQIVGVKLRGKVFPVPSGVCVRDYVDVDTLTYEEIENICKYLCEGYTDRDFLCRNRLIPPEVLERYELIRTAQTDVFVERPMWYVYSSYSG